MYGYGNKKDVTIRPNVTSWRNSNIITMFKVCRNMTEPNNMYGLKKSDSTTTLMQNSQWGAVSYLSQSKYGNIYKTADNESGIWKNPYNEGFTKNVTNSLYGMENYSTTMTGMIGIRKDDNLKRENYTDYYSKCEGNKKDNGDTIEIGYVNIERGGLATTKYTNIYYRYYTENGQKGSTTRNIYGIYDMAGGAWEYMANYLEKATNNSYVKDFLDVSPKYKSMYTTKATGNSEKDNMQNYEASQEKYGDAIWEISNNKSGQNAWSQGYFYFPSIEYPFFLRGDYYAGSVGSNLFSVNGVEGGAYSGYSFRVVLF